MRYKIAQILVVVGHWFLENGNRLSVDAFEENFDGARPFGRVR